MKQKYKHRGAKQFKIINRYDECFGPGTKAQAMLSSGKVSKEDLEVLISETCRQCKNYSCSRAGRAHTTWDERMKSQVEYLLNNPIFSDLALHFHKQISKMEIPNLKQEVESLIVNTKRGDGWDSAHGETLKEQKPKLEIDSKNSIPIPNTKVPPKPNPEIIKPSASPAPQKKPLPKNTPIPFGGIMIGGGQINLPDTNIVRPIDPWKDADQMVKPGATITIKGDGKKEE